VADAVTDRWDRIAEYYDQLVQRYGHDPRACDYGKPESQQVKFKVLSEVGSIRGRTILDIGCGFADFAVYLSAQFPGVHYSGIDLCASMIERAQRQHPELDLKIGNILEASPGAHFDFVTANGIFYLLGDDAWLTMKSLIERMYSLANLAVAFNSLSSWASGQEKGEFYADPLQTVEYCRTLTPWVVLRHDYHPRDFTVYMYRTANG
jgi:SAM-dependent methyltransferase